MSLQKKYAIEIKSRFILQGDEDISDTYERFIYTNAEVTRELVPLLIKINTMCPSTELMCPSIQPTRIANREYAGIDSSAKDLIIRKSLAWRTCNQMRNILN